MTNQEIIQISVEAREKLMTALSECSPDSQQLSRLIDNAIWGLEDLEQFFSKISS
ncbi:MAG: hypothetical protein U0K68_12980 [Agathobacter sp.]|nr:hypothetical protein [Agathobacter sp.]